MPAYSFQERFVPMILDATKKQTIRTRRIKGFARPGDPLYLYYGLRTKHCRKLREEVCDDAVTVIITEQEDIFVLPDRIRDEQVGSFEMLLEKSPVWIRTVYGIHRVLDYDKFAWMDGFRPEGSHEHNPVGCFQLMMRFWKQTHQLPFIGDLITWKPTLQIL